VALYRTAGRERWRNWAWRVRMHCNRELHKALMPTPPEAGR